MSDASPPPDNTSESSEQAEAQQPADPTNTNNAAQATTPSSNIRDRARRAARLMVNRRNTQQTQRVHVDGEGRVRLTVGNGNVVTVPLHHIRRTPSPSHGLGQNQQQQVNVRVVQVEPLIPQPVHAPRDPSEGPDPTDAEALQRFKCSICCEFMKDPAGCGNPNCSSRFCSTCLLRAIGDVNSADNRKCPTCRVEGAKLHRDDSLRAELHHPDGPKVPCRFEGCPEHELLLHKVPEHEKDCPYVQMKCRYALYGCPWQGQRKDCQAHEDQDCHLAKVKNFLKEFHKLKSDHSTRIEILQQQMGGIMRMQGVHRQNLQRDQMKSTSNVWDLLVYCHAITCTTPHFLFTKDKWMSYFRPNEGRAAVVNFLVLLPTVIACAVLASAGFQESLKLLEGNRGGGDITLLLEDAMIGICVGLLCALVLTANFADGNSSRRWRQFPIRWLGKPPVLGDLVALSLFTIHLCLLEVHGASIKSFILWAFLALASAWFPALILTLSHEAGRGIHAAAAPMATTIVSQARTIEPCLFALRYSILATTLGILPCLEAALIVAGLTKPLQGLSPRLILKNSFLEGITPSVAGMFIGPLLALATSAQMILLDIDSDATEGLDLQEVLVNLVDQAITAFVATCVLVLLNLSLHQCMAVGITWGAKIAEQARADVRPEGIQKEHNLLGLVAFGAWVSLLGAVAQCR